MLQAGKDPVEARRGQRIAAVLSAAKAMTFAECADRFIEAHAAGWRPKNTAQWRASLPPTLFRSSAHCRSSRSTPPRDEGARADLEVEYRDRRPRPQPHRAVLDWAKVHGHRTGENPARWSGHLEKLLPASAKVAVVEHHAAMPYVELPAFMAGASQRPDRGSRA